MTRKSASKPAETSRRTDPLDRDGDGRPGGSLPGNGTAPFAIAPEILRLAERLAGAGWALTPGQLEVWPEPDREAVAAWLDLPSGDPTPPPSVLDGFARAGLQETVEGDPTADAAPDAAVDLVTVTPEDPTRPAVAVRRRKLVELCGVKRFYRLADGTFGPTPGTVNGVPEQEVDVWLATGLAQDVPSAGNHGGIRITAFGRQQAYATAGDGGG